MILFLDNYDSFTYNLVQYLGEMNSDLQVVRNDKMTVEDILALKPTHIVVSPGPCTPVEAGISIPLIQAVPKTIPLLGVCLGHQAIGAAFGGSVIRAEAPMHGKTSAIENNQRDLFADLPKTFTATRYHSLIVERKNLPKELDVTAVHRDDEGGEIIMGLRHRDRPIFGVQFHPESILTEHGKALLRNFLAMKGT
jgi:anthranilate synthase/aminodeoxychorismate synthase-like glutamine amidotransferase